MLMEGYVDLLNFTVIARSVRIETRVANPPLSVAAGPLPKNVPHPLCAEAATSDDWSGNENSMFS
ncbi:hypothetical protein [Bacillus cereus]